MMVLNGFIQNILKNSTFKWNILSVKPNPANINEVFFTNHSTRRESKVFIK